MELNLTPQPLTEESTRITNQTQSGAGSTQFQVDRKQGLFMGADDYANAPFKVSFAGAVSSSSLTATGGTITGATIKAKGSSYDVWMDSTDGMLKFVDGSGNARATISTDGTYSIVIMGNDNIYFRKGAATELAQLTDDGLILPSTHKIAFSGGANLIDEGADLKIAGASGGIDTKITGNIYPDSDNDHNCGTSDKRWADVRGHEGHFNHLYCADQNSGQYITGSFGIIEWGLLSKNKSKKIFDKNGFYKPFKEERLNNKFKQGDVLVWKNGKLDLCEKDSDKMVVAVSSPMGNPFIAGAEMIKVIGKVKTGDFLVTSKTKGHARAEKEPKFGTVIAQALEGNKQGKGLIKCLILK